MSIELLSSSQVPSDLRIRKCGGIFLCVAGTGYQFPLSVYKTLYIRLSVSIYCNCMSFCGLSIKLYLPVFVSIYCNCMSFRASVICLTVCRILCEKAGLYLFRRLYVLITSFCFSFTFHVYDNKHNCTLIRNIIIIYFNALSARIRHYKNNFKPMGEN
jgi:hypothetical protein